MNIFNKATADKIIDQQNKFVFLNQDDVCLRIMEFEYEQYGTMYGGLYNDDDIFMYYDYPDFSKIKIYWTSREIDVSKPSGKYLVIRPERKYSDHEIKEMSNAHVARFIPNVCDHSDDFYYYTTMIIRQVKNVLFDCDEIQIFKISANADSKKLQKKFKERLLATLDLDFDFYNDLAVSFDEKKLEFKNCKEKLQKVNLNSW